MMQVSIILVNYNTLQVTNDCIASIKKNVENVDYEIIVVDNASSDGSIEVLAKRDDIVFVESGANIGFGCANNLGASFASGKYLFFLNTDTIFLNNVIKKLYDFCEKSEEVYGTVGCWMMDLNKNVVHSFTDSFPTIGGCIREAFSYFYRRISKTIAINQEIRSSVREVQVVCGADMFIPKVIFDEVRGFDSDYFMYGEEVELEYRIRQSGYKQIIIPEPQLVHLEGCSSGKKNRKISFFQFYSMKRGRILFYRKHKSILYRIFVFCIEGFFDLVFVLVDRRFKRKRWFYLQQYKYLFNWVKLEKQSANISLYK